MFVPGTKEPDESQRASQTDLPAQLTPLVGREQELEEACALLRSEQTRLMTLTGPGGVGKTRLGIRVAEELADEFADGVCFVSLAPSPGTRSGDPYHRPDAGAQGTRREAALRASGRASEREGTAARSGQLRAGSRSRAAGGRASGRLSPSEGAGRPAGRCSTSHASGCSLCPRSGCRMSNGYPKTSWPSRSMGP